jgi:2-polyprenyl-3-methyl-5-hydroxy-6-metoxy-1,4-benzoquinol methylase
MDPQFTKERKHIKSIFNLASLIYPLIEASLIPQYQKALEKLNLSPDLDVVDFATGTGILAAAFHHRGHSVRGFDFSPKLLKRARKKYPQIEFDQIDLFELNVKDLSKADIVSIGYLLHGLSPDLRKIILHKAADMASEYVVIFDHSNHTNWIVKFIEYLEGSHYKEFIASDQTKMFAEAGLKIVEEFRVDEFGYCWLCRKNEVIR